MFTIITWGRSWIYNNMKIWKLHCREAWVRIPLMSILVYAIRSATKIIQMRQDMIYNPHKYLSNTPGGVQASASPLKSFLIFKSPGGMLGVSKSIGWCITQKKYVPSLICIFFFLLNSVSMFIAYNICVGFDFVEMNGRWWLVDCFGNELEDISLAVEALWRWRLGCESCFLIWCYLWLYSNSREWLRLL